jgi:hypothetical protein
LIKEHLQLKTELVEGARGEFTVWVDDRKVAEKDQNGFPAEMDIVNAVRSAGRA